MMLPTVAPSAVRSTLEEEITTRYVWNVEVVTPAERLVLPAVDTTQSSTVRDALLVYRNTPFVGAVVNEPVVNPTSR